MQRPDPINFPPRLRASGNLSYLEFIALVQQLWSGVHPDIPFLATGGNQTAKFPAITYSLQLRKTHPSEPKMRIREEIATSPDQEAMLISAQRFQNVVNFTAATENDPETAEQLIEAFEDFMMEYTPVFKEMGVSEFVYARRLPDAEVSRPGEDLVQRTVSYLVTTEKVIRSSVAKLNNVIAHIRVQDRRRIDALEYAAQVPPVEHATPIVDVQDEFMTGATPSSLDE